MDININSELWGVYKSLSKNAKILLIELHEIEPKYSVYGQDYMHINNEDLAKEIKWSLPTLKKAKAELKEKAPGLVQIWLCTHTRDHITAYRLIKASN